MSTLNDLSAKVTYPISTELLFKRGSSLLHWGSMLLSFKIDSIYSCSLKHRRLSSRPASKRCTHYTWATAKTVTEGHPAQGCDKAVNSGRASRETATARGGGQKTNGTSEQKCNRTEPRGKTGHGGHGRSQDTHIYTLQYVPANKNKCKYKAPLHFIISIIQVA